MTYFDNMEDLIGYLANEQKNGNIELTIEKGILKAKTVKFGSKFCIIVKKGKYEGSSKLGTFLEVDLIYKNLKIFDSEILINRYGVFKEALYYLYIWSPYD